MLQMVQLMFVITLYVAQLTTEWELNDTVIILAKPITSLQNFQKCGLAHNGPDQPNLYLAMGQAMWPGPMLNS